VAAEISRLAPTGALIVTSPMARARQTAAAIAAALGGLPVSVDHRWREVDFGLAEGLSFAQLEDRFPALAARLAKGDPAIEWPGGESSASLSARVGAALDDLIKAGGTCLLVTHGGPLRIAHALASGADPADVAIPPLSHIIELTVAHMTGAQLGYAIPRTSAVDTAAIANPRPATTTG
jgi:probable phosphoglycerate mutase